jgi:putative endonuclease
MNQLIGDLGEKLVDRWLQLQGYQILHKHWQCRWGEIDIIALKKSLPILAFIEIKTRNSRNWDANGLLAINNTKQAKLIKTATLFLADNPDLESYPCRFDAAIVSHDRPRKITREINALAIETATIEIGRSIVISSGWKLTLLDYIENAFEIS